jgi:hypothetical protein
VLENTGVKYHDHKVGEGQGCEGDRKDGSGPERKACNHGSPYHCIARGKLATGQGAVFFFGVDSVSFQIQQIVQDINNTCQATEHKKAGHAKKQAVDLQKVPPENDTRKQQKILGPLGGTHSQDKKPE